MVRKTFYDKGADAFKNGLPRSAELPALRVEDRVDWRMGWDDAFSDSQRSNKKPALEDQPVVRDFFKEGRGAYARDVARNENPHVADTARSQWNAGWDYAYSSTTVIPPKRTPAPAPMEFTDEEVAADPILRFFAYEHLPESLRFRSQPFCNLARILVVHTPRNAERSVALRKLLEAKDAAVRAAL